eukprot:CAMPEP_0168514366 /NCGR_PEP_ID=MMETSP0405-20121227/4067_1 /TAXON_ID=498012 /ORGANISM="Trichosphaerium sp, Strain Am-I-7 wt" /LENGTH=103 /DNA_ID=CAMNT_0008533479 /DNA_START=238 /DNA_END=552 /DNA_ORIENTATION=+
MAATFLAYYWCSGYVAKLVFWIVVNVEQAGLLAFNFGWRVFGLVIIFNSKDCDNGPTQELYSFFIALLAIKLVYVFYALALEVVENLTMAIEVDETRKAQALM